MTLFFISLTALAAITACRRTPHPPPSAMDSSAATNRLADALSPYLRLHAHNPVDWYPWGDEAFEKARREGKPLIISIGYAACHWCHVMEEESFSDSEVAAVMNHYFVSVKVDREEHPDVDDYYMQAVQLMTGRGGWPLNVFVLPDGRPFYGGTYFPKHQWLNVLRSIAKVWHNHPEKVEEYATQLQEGVARLNALLPPADPPSAYGVDSLRRWYRRIESQLDEKYGGFRRAPKFPMPEVFRFLLRYHVRSAEEAPRRLALLTLRRMRNGGIYDQLGGGFARYSTDARWKVPHFEKMLYDNAQLALLYTEAYQLTHEEGFRQTALETIRFVMRELRHPEGAFFSSLDADSEGEEGKFYVWTEGEVRSAVGDENYPLVADYFGIGKEGRWEGARNVLVVAAEIPELARKYGLTPEEVEHRIEAARRRMQKAREQRPRPATDDKIVFSWNCLMVEALYHAYLVYGEEELREAADQAFAFLFHRMVDSARGRIYHVYREGRRRKTDLLEDYVGWMHVLLARYDVHFEADLLRRARRWHSVIRRRFGTDQSPILYSSSGEVLPLRTVEVSDNVIPSANSRYARAVYRLGKLTYDSSLIAEAERMWAAVQPQVERSPGFHAGWLMLYADFVEPFYQVAIVGPRAREYRRRLERRFFPFKVCAGCSTPEECTEPASMFAERWVEGRTRIYPCIDRRCLWPLEDPEEAVRRMADQ